MAGDRHLPGTDGARQVTTSGFAQVQRIGRDVIDLNGICVVSGPAGTGKTFAVDHLVRTNALPVVWLELGPHPTLKQVAIGLTQAITGGCNPKLPRYLLDEALVRELASERRVIAVDEHISVELLQYLRFLHDRPDAQWSLFLIGSRIERLLTLPELRSRVARTIRLAPFVQGGELAEALRAYHPLFEKADVTLLARVDRRYPRGTFRGWARVLEASLRINRTEKKSTFDADLAAAALVDINQSAPR